MINVSMYNTCMFVRHIKNNLLLICQQYLFELIGAECYLSLVEVLLYIYIHVGALHTITKTSKCTMCYEWNITYTEG